MVDLLIQVITAPPLSITTRKGRPPQKKYLLSATAPSSRELHTPLYNDSRHFEMRMKPVSTIGWLLAFWARCVYSRLVRRGRGEQMDDGNWLFDAERHAERSSDEESSVCGTPL